MELPADPGLSLIVYSAQPGSSTDDGLRLLAAWAATTDEQTTAKAPTEGQPSTP